MKKIVILGVVVGFLAGFTVRAEVADVLPVGGVLTDHDNEPLDGAYDMTFALYDVELGGTPLWYEQRTGANQVQVSDGLFSVELGAVESLDFLDLIAASDLWLGITVGADSEAGRIHVGSVPYAFEAQYCHQVLGSTCPVGQYLRGWDDDTGAAICEALNVSLPVGMTQNCGLSYTAGTLTILAADGVTALSSSNPCYVGIRSTTGGVSKTVAFTQNVTVTDGTSSHTDGNLFGISEASWPTPMPLFIGVICDGTSAYFTLSRMPLGASGTLATDVCQVNDTDCDSQVDAMILTTGLTLANWTSKPITHIGWLKATYATSGSAWAFALDGVLGTGFNHLYEKAVWAFPSGQNGGSSGSHLFAGTSTVPTWANPSGIQYDYKIDRNRDVSVIFSTHSAGNCTNGTGTNDYLRLALPYLSYRNTTVGGNNTTPVGIGEASAGATSSVAYVRPYYYVPSYIYIENGAVYPNVFTSSSNDIELSFSYITQ